MLATAMLLLAASGGGSSSPDALGLAELAQTAQLCSVTSVAVHGDTATVVSNGRDEASAIFFRNGQEPWRKSPLKLSHPHSIVQLPDGEWLINDTDNNRMIQVSSLAGDGSETVRTELAGIKLDRPHDQVLDPETGYVYLIDGGRHIFRFRSLDGPVDVWSFEAPREMDYARALSWFDGKLHLIHSSRGEVWRIDDYDARAYTIFRSPRPQNGPARSATPFRDFPAGALDVTGLVLNDVERFDGWYYGTNFFFPAYAHGGDVDPGRLIRWREWSDFENGRWEDLSHWLPKSTIPYFITKQPGALFIPYFGYEGSCGRSAFLKIKADR